MVKIEFIELLNYKDLLWNLVARDLTVRYKRSVLGFLWTMLNPIINTIVFTVIFSTIFRFEVKDFIIYFLSGFQLWNFFAQSTTISSRCILANGPLFKKIYIPKTIFVLSTVISGLINFMFSMLPLLALIFIIGRGFQPSMLFLPIALIMTIMFTIGISLIISACAVFFIDIVEVYSVILIPWMYLTPIIYPLEIIPPKYLPFLKLNPMYYLVECFRLPIYKGQLPGPQLILCAMFVSVGALLIGYWVFSKLADEFVYYI